MSLTVISHPHLGQLDRPTLVDATSHCSKLPRKDVLKKGLSPTFIRNNLM